jgi:DNA uptake protein ComE-like DNA-binding protein
MGWLGKSIQSNNAGHSKGILMMLRPSIVRSVILTSAMLCALLVTACSYGNEKAQTNTTASNASVATTSPSNSNAAAANTTNTTAGQSAAGAKLNLNTASPNEFLARIPGLGNRMVHEFEEYRPYKSVQQFRREMGKYVKPDQIAEYEKYVYVPIAENEADAPTLQQIPGLDATEAEALIAGRPYASRDAFLAKLSEKVSAEELAVAKTYLGGQ